MTKELNVNEEVLEVGSYLKEADAFFVQTPKAILFTTQLNAQEKILWQIIYSFKGKKGVVFPKNQTLAERMNVDVSSIKRYKSSLIEKGFLISKRRGKQLSNIYTITIPKTAIDEYRLSSKKEELEERRLFTANQKATLLLLINEQKEKVRTKLNIKTKDFNVFEKTAEKYDDLFFNEYIEMMIATGEKMKVLTYLLYFKKFQVVPNFDTMKQLDETIIDMTIDEILLMIETSKKETKTVIKDVAKMEEAKNRKKHFAKKQYEPTKEPIKKQFSDF